jgi:hypothetical protein
VKRDGLAGFSISSLVLRDDANNVVVPHMVGGPVGDAYGVFLKDHGLNSSSMVKARSASGTPIYKFGYTPENTVGKRGCDKFQEGKRYTKTGK